MEKEELFKEVRRHLLEDEKPSIYLNSLLKHPLFQEEPFLLLSRLKQTPQSKKYHPEGDAWNHTMLVVDEAAKRKKYSKNPEVFLFGALLHDIGKPSTTKMRHGRWTSYNHDREGVALARQFLSYFSVEEALIQKVCALVAFHMHILYVTKDLPFAETERMKKEADIDEIALLGYCDRMGRTNADREEEKENIRAFYRALHKEPILQCFS